MPNLIKDFHLRLFARSCGLVLMLSLLNSSVCAAVETHETETVTITGQRPDFDFLKGDLDPTAEHFEGLTGEKISRDIDPLDRYDAFMAFARGLTGPVGDVYDWHGLRDDGFFRPTREFFQAGLLCRDFVEETNHHGVESLAPNKNTDSRPPIVLGTACRERDGWHFR